MRATALTLLAAACVACTDDGPRVLVGVPGGSSRAVRIEVSILRSCDEITSTGGEPEDALRTVEVTRDGAESFGSVASGTYGLYGRAWEAGCVLYAAGCSTVEIAPGTASIAVELSKLEPPLGCDRGTTCVDDRCVSPNADRDAATDAEADTEPEPLECGETAPCASALTDDFDDGEIGSGWVTAAQPGCTVLEDGGEAIFAPPSFLAEPGFCVYTSATVYELDGVSVTVEVTQATSSAATAETFLSIALTSGDDLLVMTKTGPDIRFLAANEAGLLAEVGRIAYDPNAHRWWRIREDEGSVFWETSPDGRSWTTGATDPGPFPLDEILMSIGAGTTAWTEDPAVAHFDNFNLPPEQ